MVARAMALFTPTAIEPEWEAVLARALGRSVDPRSLAIMVERLSRIYNGEPDATPLARADALAARALFWFPRDLRKVALAAHELVAANALPRRALRIVDLGAGLGATSLGWLRALAGTAVETARIDAIDHDAEALARMHAIAKEASRAKLLAPLPPITTSIADFREASAIRAALQDASAPCDVLLIGSALVEATRDAGDESARGALVAKHVHDAIDAVNLAADGTVVIIEPATRAETRALHHARAQLIAGGLHVFAPCTHQGACPMLERDRDWCHEDLAADLPEWLVPIARAAGLRWEGLTFSYLVMQRASDHSVGSLAARPGYVPARLVSQPRATKGKTESFASVAGRGARLMQLDRSVKRDAGEHRALADSARGDVVGLREEVLVDAVVRVEPRDVVPAAGRTPPREADG
jgi:hypothetical protein